MPLLYYTWIPGDVHPPVMRISPLNESPRSGGCDVLVLRERHVGPVTLLELGERLTSENSAEFLPQARLPVQIVAKSLLNLKPTRKESRDL